MAFNFPEALKSSAEGGVEFPPEDVPRQVAALIQWATQHDRNCRRWNGIVVGVLTAVVLGAFAYLLTSGAPWQKGFDATQRRMENFQQRIANQANEITAQAGRIDLLTAQQQALQTEQSQLQSAQAAFLTRNEAISDQLHLLIGKLDNDARGRR